MKNSELWKKAKKVISEPAKWTQGEAAREIGGCYILPTDKGAVCFCIVGALQKSSIVYNNDQAACTQSHEDFRKVMNVSVPIGIWNDAKSRTHEEVMEAMDKMISYYEGKGE